MAMWNRAWRKAMWWPLRSRALGPFRAKGKQSHVRVIASLFTEDVHLVVATKSKIKSVADLRGKRVSFGLPGSGVGFTARRDSHSLSMCRSPACAASRWTRRPP